MILDARSGVKRKEKLVKQAKEHATNVAAGFTPYEQCGIDEVTVTGSIFVHGVGDFVTKEDVSKHLDVDEKELKGTQVKLKHDGSVGYLKQRPFLTPEVLLQAVVGGSASVVAVDEQQGPEPSPSTGSPAAGACQQGVSKGMVITYTDRKLEMRTPVLLPKDHWYADQATDHYEKAAHQHLKLAGHDIGNKYKPVDPEVQFYTSDELKHLHKCNETDTRLSSGISGLAPPALANKKLRRLGPIADYACPQTPTARPGQLAIADNEFIDPADEGRLALRDVDGESELSIGPQMPQQLKLSTFTDGLREQPHEATILFDSDLIDKTIFETDWLLPGESHNDLRVRIAKEKMLA